MRRVEVWVLGVVLCGCSTALSPAGQRVRVGKATPHANCKELGIIYGSGSGGGYTSSESKMRSAQNELRNKTADMGGNFVVMDAAGGDVAGLTLTGRAFRCGAEPVPTVAANDAKSEEPTAGAPPKDEPALTPEQRLARLKDLLDKGLITQAEHDQRRQEILQSL
jgi:hypothetical protein